MEKPRRILIFSLTYHPFVGGAEVAVKEITDRFDPTKYEFDMVTLRLDRNLPTYQKLGAVHIHRVGLFPKAEPNPEDLVHFPMRLDKYLMPLTALWKATELHRERHYDGTWAIMANLAGAAALFFKYIFPRVPLILTLQEGDTNTHIKRRVGPFFYLWKQIFLKADIIQVISTYLKAWAESFGVREKIVIIPNGVDFSRFATEYSKVELDDLKEKLGKRDGDVFVITTSRLFHKNAVDVCIKALTHLPSNFKLLILGEGPLEGELKNLSRSLGLDSRVYFLGHIENYHLPRYLKVSDIFIRPSRSEGMGNSFIEAMAAGLPVIATPIGGIVDFLFDPEKNPDKKPTGIFCNVDDPKSAAKSIMKIQSDPTLASTVSENAISFIRKRHDWIEIAERMEKEVFGKVVKS